MAKLPNYNGSIDLISGLRPKNNGTFPLMEAHDVQVTETQRLDEMFTAPESWLPTVTANPTETATEELQKLKVGNTVYSVEGGGSGVTIDIMQTGASGTLTAEQVALIVNNFPNVNINWLGDIFMPLEYTTDNYKFAKVQTSDTQAETKLFNVNTTTNEWTFTQYLADLGGGGSSGGLTKTKVTLAELQAMITEALTEAESGNEDKIRALMGSFVTFNVRMEVVMSEEINSDDFSTIIGFENCSCLTFKIGTTVGWVGYFTEPYAEAGTAETTGTQGLFTVATKGIQINNTGAHGIVYSQLIKSKGAVETVGPADTTNYYVNDTNFDFYIYK